LLGGSGAFEVFRAKERKKIAIEIRRGEKKEIKRRWRDAAA